MRHVLLSVVFASSLLAQTAPDARSEPRPRSEVGRELASALRIETADASDAARDADAVAAGAQRLRMLQTAGRSAAAELPAESLAAERLLDAVDAAAVVGSDQDRDRARRLAARLAEVADDLRFAPLREAPTPADWPAPAPVGDVVIKEYPAYRMATAPMRSQGDMSAFGKLFRHIQSNDIPMTAPVQMDHAAGVDREVGERRGMSFLYEDQARGQVGKAGDVEIVDVPAAIWASIGARGYETRDSIDDLRAALLAWLRQHAARYEVVGPLRVMGWNSPSVRGDRRFYEVELPLRLRRDV